MRRVVVCVLGAVLALSSVVVIAGPSAPAAAVVPAKRYTQVSVGFRHACARGSDGTAICWGTGGAGQLGDGGTVARADQPVVVRKAGTALADSSISQIAAGQYSTCAVAGGKAFCWGEGSAGQLGNGAETDSPVAVAVTTAGTPLAGRTVEQVAVSANHACAVTTDGVVACWGSNTFGQIGDNTQTRRSVPTSPMITGTALQGAAVAQVAVASSRTCVVTTAGGGACWGDNGGTFGNGGTADSRVAVAVTTAGTPLAGKQLVAIDTNALSAEHTCAVTSDGNAACWGSGSSGRLGNGSTASSTLPVAVTKTGTALAGKTIRTIDTGGLATCATSSDGSLACWGSNNWGSLGNGTTIGSSTTAVAVRKEGTALAGASVIGVSSHEPACAVASDGRVACWGSDTYGTLGNGGATVNSNVPVGVLTTAGFGPFTSNATLVAQQFRDLVGRAPTASEQSTWVARLDGGQTGGQLVAALRVTSAGAAVDSVARLYWAYFGRVPDASGLDYWISVRRSGTSLSVISSRFAASAEFRATYGSLSNRQFVELVYANVLGRPGEGSGVDFWTGQLDGGQRSRGAVMTGFSESTEYKGQMASRVTVVVLYVAMLRRAPTTTELTAEVSSLGSASSVAALADRLLGSGEYADRFR